MTVCILNAKTFSASIVAKSRATVSSIKRRLARNAISRDYLTSSVLVGSLQPCSYKPLG